MRDLHLQMLQLMRSGRSFAWATVIRSAGSTPQKPGSHAIFDETGLITGTVGGGIMEAEVEKAARELLKSGKSNLFKYRLDQHPDGTGSLCGGEADVLIDGDPCRHRTALEAIENSLNHRSGGSMITVVGRETDGSRNISRHWIPRKDPASLSTGPETQVRAPGAEELQENPSADLVFLQEIRPLPELVIAGAGHLGRALSHLGSLLGFEVTVIDDRPGYASRTLLPDADHVVVKAFGDVFRSLKPGPDSYYVIVTRDHRQDGEALKPLLGSDAAYVGMIGSRHKAGLMKKEFLANGWATPEQWESIHTPVGLPIGSVTVQEIAISIAAQLIEVRSKKQKSHG